MNGSRSWVKICIWTYIRTIGSKSTTSIRATKVAAPVAVLSLNQPNSCWQQNNHFLRLKQGCWQYIIFVSVIFLCDAWVLLVMSHYSCSGIIVELDTDMIEGLFDCDTDCKLRRHVRWIKSVLNMRCSILYLPSLNPSETDVMATLARGFELLNLSRYIVCMVSDNYWKSDFERREI